MKKLRIFAGDTLQLSLSGGEMLQWQVMRRCGNQEKKLLLASVTSTGVVIEHAADVSEITHAIDSGALTHNRRHLN